MKRHILTGWAAFCVGSLLAVPACQLHAQIGGQDWPVQGSAQLASGRTSPAPAPVPPSVSTPSAESWLVDAWCLQGRVYGSGGPIDYVASASTARPRIAPALKAMLVCAAAPETQHAAMIAVALSKIELQALKSSDSTWLIVLDAGVLLVNPPLRPDLYLRNYVRIVATRNAGTTLP